MVKIATSATFTELISGNKPIVVDFWATWCGPCRALSPIVDEVAEEYDGKAVVVKCIVRILRSNMVSEIYLLFYFLKMERLSSVRSEWFLKKKLPALLMG